MVAGAMQAAFLSPEARAEMIADQHSALWAGSVASMGQAVREGDGYRLNGQWRLASGCHHAEWLGGTALVMGENGPIMNADGSPDVKLMFFRQGEAQILDTWNSLGMRGTGSTDFRLEGIHVPAYRTFSLFTAPPVSDGPLFKAGILVLFSLSLASVMPGIAQAGIDAFVELAGGKTPTMSQTTLGSRPTIHAEVARAQMLVDSARAYLHEVGNAIQASVEAGGGVTEELEIRRRLACVNSAASCRQAVDIVHELAGTTSINTGHPLEQALRDMHTAAQHFLVSPAWLEKTGQYYFGQGLGMP
jgi:alkylation response protein AidB-like acyl-CoA dehydrogenase